MDAAYVKVFMVVHPHVIFEPLPLPFKTTQFPVRILILSITQLLIGKLHLIIYAFISLRRLFLGLLLVSIIDITIKRGVRHTLFIATLIKAVVRHIQRVILLIILIRLIIYDYVLLFRFWRCYKNICFTETF